MRWTSIMAIYFILWVLCAFVVLPFGIQTHDEAGHEKIRGQADSAPANFRPLRVMGYTTIVSLVILVLFVLNYNEGWITFKDIDFFDRLIGADSGGG